MKPIAMNRPCGEIAKLSPMRKRSTTGQPMEPNIAIGAIGRRA